MSYVARSVMIAEYETSKGLVQAISGLMQIVYHDGKQRRVGSELWASP